MRTMYYRLLMLAAWLVFFYNLERASKFVSRDRIDLLTPYAYVFVAFVAIITLGLPALHRLPLPALLAAGLVGFVGAKAWFGYPLVGSALPVTITEICAVLVTGLLTRQVIGAVREFETSVVNFTIARIGRETRDFSIEQGEMYQEVRRARAFHRPLVLIAIEPESGSFRVTQEKMVEEVQRATMKQYVFAALAKTLADQLGPYGIIAQDGDKFLVLLPEVSKEDIPRLAAQLRGKAQESIGLELQIGTATMPEVGTFDELVEAAYAEMGGKIHQKPGEAVTTRVTSVRGELTS